MLFIAAAVLSFFPAIVVGTNVVFGTFGAGVLCYFLSLVASIVGFYIGKFLNAFVGDRIIATKDGFLGLVFAKFFAMYGPQLVGFFVGLILPTSLFGV